MKKYHDDFEEAQKEIEQAIEDSKKEVQRKLK